MSTTHNSLIEALVNADMLEIDGLYAWEFSLDKELLAQVSAGSANTDSQAKPLLSMECIDGRDRRHWRFTLGQVSSANYDSSSDTWSIDGDEKSHSLKCSAAISGNNEDTDDDSSNDA